MRSDRSRSAVSTRRRARCLALCALAVTLGVSAVEAADPTLTVTMRLAEA